MRISSPDWQHAGRLCVALVLAVFLAACAGSETRSVIPATSSSSGEYLIGPGDQLQIFVWRQPELTATVPVRPDGRISTPLVEDIEAVGKTPAQLAAEIEAAISEFIRAPEVTVIVQSFVGTFGDQIRVLGQVVNPGAVPYRSRMTLLDVMIEVGGVTEFAAANRSRLVRSVGGERQEMRVRIGDLIDRGRTQENIEMLPGDIVIVPEAVF